MKLTDLTSKATLAAAVMPPMSLVVPKLGTTNDGGGTSPAEAKIIAGGPHTRCGWGGNAGSINTEACFDTCESQGQQLDGKQPASFLEGSLGGLILTVTHSSQ